MSWIQTVTGKRLDLLDPDPANIDIIDIAWGLSGTNRYQAQTTVTWSVANHSLVLARYIAAVGGSAVHVRLTLMHDASEYVLGDPPAPYKHTGAFDEVEKLHRIWTKRIADRFDLLGPSALVTEIPTCPFRCNTIHLADKGIVEIERSLFHRYYRDDWGDRPVPPIPPHWLLDVCELSRTQQVERFLQVFRAPRTVREARDAEEVREEAAAPTDLLAYGRKHLPPLGI